MTGVGREPRFRMHARSSRWLNCAYRRRAALRSQTPKAVIGQNRPVNKGPEMTTLAEAGFCY